MASIRCGDGVTLGWWGLLPDVARWYTLIGQIREKIEIKGERECFRFKLRVISPYSGHSNRINIANLQANYEICLILFNLHFMVAIDPTLSIRPPITTSRKVQTKTIRKHVLGRPPRPNRNLTAVTRIQKVKTYDSVQRAQQLARARYAAKKDGKDQPAPPPPPRNFKRGRKIPIDRLLSCR
jgi:hypothetical protein